MVFTIGPGDKVRAAVKLLIERDIGALVVTNNKGRVVGIISERDIIRKSSLYEKVFDVTVADVMTREVIVGLPQDDIMSVAHTMTENHFRHLPILDREQLVGIISIGDVLKAQRDTYRGEIDTLETQILANKD